jgi:hypothetical protein
MQPSPLPGTLVSRVLHAAVTTSVLTSVSVQIQLYAQRHLATALAYEGPSELEFATLAALKALALGQVSGAL